MRRQFNDEEVNMLNNGAMLIRDYTDLGLSMWTSVFTKGGDMTYQIPPVLLFGQILESTDSISELIKLGCIASCKPLLRSAVDCYLQFSFLLEKDQKKRSSHFLFHYNKKKLNELERILFASSKNSLNEKISGDRLLKEIKLTDEEMAMAKIDYETLLDIIDSDENITTAEEYGDKNVRYWYNFFIKPASIDALAKYLQEVALYEIIFKPLSSFLHGEDIIHNNIVFSVNEMVGVKSLRDISQLNFMVSHTSILLKRTITLFILKEMNGNLELLSRLHLLWERTKIFRN